MDDVVEVLETVEKSFVFNSMGPGRMVGVCGMEINRLDRLLSNLILLWKDDGKLLTGFNGNL